MSFDALINTSSMSVHGAVLDDRSGRRVLTVIAKMTWAVSHNGEVSIPAARRAVRVLPVWAGAPTESSLRYPLDICTEKPGTDVLLVGVAHPPPGRTVTEMDVGLRVQSAHGDLSKVARVYGRRVWVAGAFGVVPGPPDPLEPTPLDYEHTWGGADRSDPRQPLVDWRNPIGTGVTRDRASLVGRPAPSIEDPTSPLTSRAPAPAGFGPIPADWEPRASFGGTYDETWRRRRAPLAPVDRDPRFESVAPPGLWSRTPLQGDEPIDVVGMRPEGLWRIRLPRCAPSFRFTVRGAGTFEQPTALDTLLVDASLGEVELTFRATVAAPRKLAWIERVVVADAVPLPEHLFAARRPTSMKERA